MRIPTSKLTESQWQDLRQSLVNKGMVGGSDAGTLLGINKYKSAISLYYQSLNIASLPTKINSAILHGKQLEDYVASCWQYYDGTEEGWVANTLADNKIKQYKKDKAIIINPKYPNLFANIDGIITKHPDYSTKGILEVKTMSGYSADTYEGGIPPSYLVQLQHYLLVTGYKWGEIVYLKDGRELGCVTFDEDKQIQESILKAADEFNRRVTLAQAAIKDVEDPNIRMQIASQFEPEADNSMAFNDFISEKHKARENEVTIDGTDEHEQWAMEYKALSDNIKLIESEKQLYQNKLKQVMESYGATIMNLPNGKITWRKSFNVRL